MRSRQQNEEGNENSNNNTVSPERMLYDQVRKRFLDSIAKRLVKVAEPKTDPLVQQVQDQLPKETEEIRNLPFYDSTLQALQYQRDQYLMGTKYAQQKAKKQPSRQQPGSDLNPLNAKYDPTSLASQQIIPLGANFLPSPTVHQALLPIVVSLPSGTLREPILNATVNSIPMGQPALNDAVKNSMIQFLSDPQNRLMVQNQTNRTLIGNRR